MRIQARTGPPGAAAVNRNPIEPTDVVVRTFEAVRQAPGAPYDPDRLPAYLTEPPEPTGRRVSDTFAGRRRFVKFMETLQLEFGICFTNEEWERGFGLVDLTRVIEAKPARRPHQARLAARRVLEARHALVGEPIKFGILSGAVLAAAGAATRSVAVYVLLGTVWVAVVRAVAAVNVSGYGYAKRLAERTGRQ